MNIQFRSLETKRKLLVLASTYKEKVGRTVLPASIRSQHEHMFGLTVLDDLGVDSQSVTRSRSGLIITETMLGFLDIADISPGAFSNIVSKRVNVSTWATSVYPEWVLPAEDANVGRWWISPVLADLLEHPSSSIRSVTLGLEAMGVIQRRRAKHQHKPKSRAQAVRLTAFGKALLEDLKQGPETDIGDEE